MKVYTALLFNEGQIDPHCTHKYLGVQSDENVGRIWVYLDKYFGSGKRKAPPVVFDKFEWFGPELNIRALTPSVSVPIFEAVRAQLDHFAPNTYGKYRPHVSLGDFVQPSDEPNVKFSKPPYYALICKDRILACWPLDIS